MIEYAVGDFVIRIKNAVLANRRTVSVPYAKIVKQIALVLVQARYLASVKEDIKEGRKVLVIEIAYANRIAVFTDARLISKPSCRVYAGATDDKLTKKGLGITVVSTSKGMMTGRQARKENIGGEVLFAMW